MWEREEDLRNLPIRNPCALSQRPIKTTACNISRYVPVQVAKPTPDVYHRCWRANSTTVVSMKRTDGMDEDLDVWMYPQKLTIVTDNADPILKHKKTPRPCLSRKGSCRKAQEAPWRSWSRWWYASPQVHPFFECAFRSPALADDFTGSTLTSTTLVISEKLVCDTFT